jgi:DNA-binding protein H-NS
MDELDLEAMKLDDLWVLHEQITNILSQRMLAEKRQLENRLVLLSRGTDLGRKQPRSTENRASPRRNYPKVVPKYQNPRPPHETWSGRGKKPRWLVLALKDGFALDDFRITVASGSK